jgi:hypothetical protein
LLSLLSVAAVGCGDHGLPPGYDMAVPDDLSGAVTDMGIPDDAKKVVTFSTFAQDYAQTLCAHYLACGQLDAAQMNACLERNLRHTGWDQDVEIMKGRVEINELQCLDALKNARCDSSDSGSWQTRCIQFLYTGHQANGSACLANDECVSGYCQHAGSDAGMPAQVTGCPGTCAPAQGLGAPCRISSDCATGSECDRFTTHTCVAQAALNESCTNALGVGSGPSCLFGPICPTFPTTMPPKCVLPTMQTTLHGDCDPFQGAESTVPACATGMYCRFKYTAGAACTGAPGDCAATLGAYCDTTAGTCQNPSGGSCETKIASGADCDPNNDSFLSSVDSQCADGTFCYQLPADANPKCHAFGSSGAGCVKIGGALDTCKIGLYCNAAVNGTCVPWFTDGATCDTSFHCPSGEPPVVSVCIADNADAGTNLTCQAEKNVGATCTPGFEDALCANADLPGSSYCVPAGSSGVCAPKCF